MEAAGAPRHVSTRAPLSPSCPRPTCAHCPCQPGPGTRARLPRWGWTGGRKHRAQGGPRGCRTGGAVTQGRTLSCHTPSACEQLLGELPPVRSDGAEPVSATKEKKYYFCNPSEILPRCYAEVGALGATASVKCCYALGMLRSARVPRFLRMSPSPWVRVTQHVGSSLTRDPGVWMPSVAETHSSPHPPGFPPSVFLAVSPL